MIHRYNPLTGSRLDLEVTAEDNRAAVAARWNAKRAAYLRQLLAAAPSPFARRIYQRELAQLQPK